MGRFHGIDPVAWPAMLASGAHDHRHPADLWHHARAQSPRWLLDIGFSKAPMRARAVECLASAISLTAHAAKARTLDFIFDMLLMSVFLGAFTVAVAFVDAMHHVLAALFVDAMLLAVPTGMRCIIRVAPVTRVAHRSFFRIEGL